MKKVSIILLTVAAFLLGACKTTENQESMLDSKRAEIEAIATHYSDINPYGPANWSTLQGLLKEDKVVEHFDIDLYRQCLDLNIAIAQEKVSLMKESGCRALYDKFFYSTPDHEETAFRQQNATALAKCDSIQKIFEPRSEKAMVPCMEWAKKLQLANQKN